MKKSLEKFSSILEILPFALVFLFNFKFPIDSDFGWHLKQGEYFINNHQILDFNIFSSLMPGFQYINSYLLSDALEYLIFHSFSFYGIAILGALVVTLIYYFSSRIANLNFWQKTFILPLFIFLGDINTRLSFRHQILSILFLVIIIYILRVFKENPKKYLILIPIIIVIWVNSHGEFILGPITITLWTACEIFKSFIKTKKISFREEKDLILLVIASFLATLVNPYGYRIYEIVFAHLYNPGVLSKVSEWVSPFKAQETTIVLIISILIFTISLVFLAYYRKVNENLFFILFPVPFLIQAISHTRYLWIFIYLLIPLFGFVLTKTKPKNINHQRLISLIILITLYLLIGFYSFPFKSFIRPNWDTYCINVNCSPKAAEYLSREGTKGILFTQFEYGGWLIWNYPRIKTLIDGRMHVWKDKNGYSAFEEYYQLEQGIKSVENSKYSTVFINRKKPIYKKMGVLVKNKKWKLIYEDFYSEIYVRL